MVTLSTETQTTAPRIEADTNIGDPHHGDSHQDTKNKAETSNGDSIHGN